MVDLDIEKLTIEERLDLIALLWDSIPNTLEALPVPEWHKRILAERLEWANAHPGEGIPLEEVKQRLLERRQ